MTAIFSPGRYLLCPGAAAFICLFMWSPRAWSIQASTEEDGRIRGEVVDHKSASIPNATIRVMLGTTGSTRYRVRGRSDGSFHLNGIQPGTYTVALSVHGFREKFVDNVVVNTGREVDLGRLPLQLAGCDAPWIICDSISTEPAPNTTVVHGEIKLPLECSVDIDKGKLLCPAVRGGPSPASPTTDHSSDFRLHVGSDHHLYLEPQNSARLAEPNSAEADCGGAIFLDRSIRVNGLGPGSDLCVRSSEGRYAHIFFTGEVQPDSRQIEVYYVTTRK
ncbi:MAG: hypothetical protein JWO80_2656 [Bryobacterales bacterium]|nr:hypothetical protein [Bryobacterales bacterium]